ncbi:ATP-grasp domain-containing protein [Candidatus Daviesbacteria bacterium]|nr:ATP-grasp domain-containing protein [Candidatus Daviesbacteria bacterium]
MKKILVITGGTSSERKISLISAENVKKGLEEVGYQQAVSSAYKVKLFDLKKGFSELKKISQDFDLIFPVIHGKEGEDGTLYTFLKKLNKPFVGCGPKSTEIAFDKILFNQFCDQNEIPKPEWKVVKNTLDIKKFGFPCVLKAARGGSSKEVVILLSEKDLKNPLVKKIFSLDDYFLVERYVKGIEITVGVFSNQALPVIEIIPPDKGWFDYKNKYSGESKEIVGAPSLDEKTKNRAQQIALKLHQTLSLNPYSRTDMIVLNNTPFVLEVNPPCGVGMTSQSLMPKAAQAFGLEFPQLLDKIIKSALKITP